MTPYWYEIATNVNTHFDFISHPKAVDSHPHSHKHLAMARFAMARCGNYAAQLYPQLAIPACQQPQAAQRKQAQRGRFRHGYTSTNGEYLGGVGIRQSEHVIVGA